MEAVSTWTGRAVSWASLALVLLVTFDVALRYLLGVSFVADEELEWHLFSIMFLLGAAHTLKKGGHVRVDVLYQRLPRRGRAAVDLAGSLLFLFPGCFLVIKTSLPFVKASWMMHEGSPDPGGLPARYLLKAAIPVGFGLVALQGIPFFLRALREFRGEGRGDAS